MKNMYKASECLQTGCLLFVGIHTKKNSLKFSLKVTTVHLGLRLFRGEKFH